MSNGTSSTELQHLVSRAVEQALKQRKLTDTELKTLLHGPITIGIIASPQATTPQAGVTEFFKAPSVHDVRLIGFVAPNIEQLKAELGKTGG